MMQVTVVPRLQENFFVCCLSNVLCFIWLSTVIQLCHNKSFHIFAITSHKSRASDIFQDWWPGWPMEQNMVGHFLK